MPIISFILLILMLAGGCREEKIDLVAITKADFPVAIIDGNTSIMASTLYRRLADGGLLETGGLLDSSIYFDTLRAIVVDSVVGIEARDVDLRDDKTLYRTYLMRYYDFFLGYVYQHLIVDSIQADSMIVDSVYRANARVYKLPEQVRARHLVISSKGLRHGKDSTLYRDYPEEQLDSIAKEMVYRLRQRIDSGEVLGNLALQYSMHRLSGDNHGDLEYFTRGTYNEEFEKQAFGLPKGAVSEPFKTPDGWHLVQVIDHIDSGLPPLTPELYADAERRYRTLKAAMRSKVFIDSVSSLARVEYNDSLLSLHHRKVPDSNWAAVVNEKDTITFYRLADIMDFYATQMNLDSLTLDDRRRAVFREAQKYIVIQAAADLGYADDTNVVAERTRLFDKYARDLVRREATDPTYEPPDSLVEDYYKRNIEKYRFEKPIYVQHIITQDSLFGEYLRDQALAGIDFLKLAKENYPGAEEIRVAAADLGYIGPGEMPENFYKAAILTPKNNVSHPVKTEWGYHIIKVLDRKNDKPLQEVRAQIAAQLRAEYAKIKAAAWENDLLERHQISYNLGRLPKIELPPKSRR